MLLRRTFILTTVILGLVSVVAIATPARATVAPLSTIVSGVPWHTQQDPYAETRALSSTVVQSHTPSILHFGGNFYMLGLDRSNGHDFSGVRCYESSGLSHWSAKGLALAPTESVPDLRPDSVVERPRVIYNASTHQFVMWIHVDNTRYTEARAGIAVSPSPCGPYKYLGSSRPLGHASRDIGLFKDSDGTAYLLSEDRSVYGLRIDRLSWDYERIVNSAGPGGSVALLHPYGRKSMEAPAMVKVDGRYWLFGSRLTGFRSNDNLAMSAESLDGFWTSPVLFAPAGSKTYRSQTDGILVIAGTKTTTYIYLGDRWDPRDLDHSTSVWYPITFNSGAPSLVKRRVWTINTATGQWHGGA